MSRRNRIRMLAAERGITIAELAIAVGMQPPALRRYTRHEAEPKLEIAQAIAAYFDVPVDQVLGTEPDSWPLQKISVSERAQRIPVFGAAQGGIGFDVTDVDAPVDWLPRPQYLDGANDPYGVYIVGDSMEPRFFAGEIVFVHPGKPVKRGDYVVVQLAAGSEKHAIVKQFRGFGDGHLLLEQLNPPKEVRFPRDAVLAVHRIVGTQF